MRTTSRHYCQNLILEIICLVDTQMLMQHTGSEGFHEGKFVLFNDPWCQ